MATSTSYTRTLERNAGKPPKAQILALLCTPRNDAYKVRSWLISNGSVDLRQIARDDTQWLHLVQAARKHRATSQKTTRRNTIRRMVSHSLRSFSTTSSRTRKARLIAAIAGSEMLAAAEQWDTWLCNQHNLAVKLGVSRPTVRAWLKIAVEEGVLDERAPADSGERRFFLKKWPTAHKPTEVERLASASIERGSPNELAQWILSVAHPAWGWTPKPDVPEGDRIPPYLNHASWERRVLNAAGIRLIRGKAEIALADFPSDLDLCLDAIAAFAEAWERREEEAIARGEAVAENRALNDLAMADLRSRNWPPAKGQLSPWIREVRISLASRPLAPELTTTFDAVLKRALKRRYPDKAEDIFAAIREDFFA